LFLDRDWRHAEGRWFTGAYNELGLDVRLHRVGADPVVLGTAESMIKTGASQQLHLFGEPSVERVAGRCEPARASPSIASSARRRPRWSSVSVAPNTSSAAGA
jgi:hypothetical protein